MKRVIISLWLAMTIAFSLSGCGTKTDSRITIRFWRDRDTNVQYIMYGSHGICPRYNADGTLYTSEE